MTNLGKGGVAAYGLNYQYLATANYFLRHLREHPELIQHATLIVEPLFTKPDGKEDDIVDFAIEIDDLPTHHVQAKATTDPDQYPLQPATARDVLTRLLDHAAQNSILLTNKPLSPELAIACDANDADHPASTYIWSTGPLPPPDRPANEPLIVVDTRSPSELRSSIAEQIRYFRKHRRLGQGLTSSRLLVPILLDFIFNAAAGNEPSRITALDLLAKIHMPDPQIAEIAGGFDWGLPMTGIPYYASIVPRMAILDEVIEHLTPDDTQTVPTRMVLTGLTGIGKSVIATDYCHIDRISYHFVCWINCRDTSMIAPRIRDIVAQLTNDVVPPAVDIGPIFTGMLGRHPGPWLLVFDGIQNASDIDQYVPTIGRGSVLVTTNNSLGWWEAARQREVGLFTQDEAIDCFAAYAGVRADALHEARESIRGIVERLGRIPLAVSMAGLYFRNTQGRLDELAVQYFADLASLEDSYSIPRGFTKTAFDAIRYAVEHLGVGTQSGDKYRRDAQALLYAGSFLAPELLPVNLLLPASTGQLHVQLSSLPTPAEVDPTLRRGVIATLRTQTIAHRSDNAEYDRRTPASETVAVHPLVHKILQRYCLSRVSSAGPGELQSMASSLMYFLIGWLGTLRTDGSFFAVEQLRMHAEALLDLVTEREPLSTPSPEHDKYYKYLKAMLQVELSTCQFSRRNLEAAYTLGFAAAQTLSTLANDPTARLIAMKSISNQVTDLSYADAPAALVAIHVSLLLQFCLECEASPKEGIRDCTYIYAGEALQMITRTPTYRDSWQLQVIAAELRNIGSRDPKPQLRTHISNALINQLVDSRQYNEILERLPEWRSLDNGVHNAVTFDALEIVAELHTRKFEEAMTGIQKLLELKPYGQHLLLFTHEALKKIAKALHEIIPTAGNDSGRMKSVLENVLARYYHLGGDTNPGSARNI